MIIAVIEKSTLLFIQVIRHLPVVVPLEALKRNEMYKDQLLRYSFREFEENIVLLHFSQQCD